MRSRPWLRPLACLLLVIPILVLAGAAAIPTAPEEGGDRAAQVIDGDTLQVDGATIQLYGLDAPELGQLCESGGSTWPCGVAAALALRKLVRLNDQGVHCSPWQAGPPERTADDALVEVCEAGEQDLALVMLRGGYGVAPPGSFPDYLEAEERAKEARLGLWHSRFELPWVWRAGASDPAQPGPALRDCNVKGATDADGGRVYHVPTDPGYKQVVIDPSRGERMFCSDEEARLAGWRRPAEPTGSG